MQIMKQVWTRHFCGSSSSIRCALSDLSMLQQQQHQVCIVCAINAAAAATQAARLPQQALVNINTHTHTCMWKAKRAGKQI